MTSGKQLYMYDGFVFCFAHSTKEGSRWRCNQCTLKTCRAKITISKTGEFVSANGFHNHPRHRYIRDLRSIPKRWSSLNIPGVLLQSAEVQQQYRPMEMHHGTAGNGEEVHCQAVHRGRLPGEFLWTKRGGKHPLLLYSGYTYSYQKENALGRISWYCSRRLRGCRASAVSYGTRVFAYKPHDHPPPKITPQETQQETDPVIIATYSKSLPNH